MLALQALLLIICSTARGEVKGSSSNIKHPKYNDIGANLEDHPDPNDEDYENMIYIGRYHLNGNEDHVVHVHDVTMSSSSSSSSDDSIDNDKNNSNDDEKEVPVSTTEQSEYRRLGFHVDNGVKYIFGTSFDESHRDIELKDLHQEQYDYDFSDHDLPDRSRSSGAGTGQRKKTRQEALKEIRHKQITEPKPFGYVDTHPLDGGVMPPKVVHVEPFFLDATLVTNQEFGKFVKSTYYETEAEKYGWSFVLASFLPSDHLEKININASADDVGAEDGYNNHMIQTDPEAEFWVTVDGAYWRKPEGDGSSYKFREHHPVTHVSHRDAAEYCKWKGKRLPGEWEWEAAARAGFWYPNNRTLFTWGDEDSWKVASQYANLWGGTDDDDDDDDNHDNNNVDDSNTASTRNSNNTKVDDEHGIFPWSNNGVDGWRGTSPVRYYPPNNFGFYDMIGNVWEWQRGGKHKARIVRGGSYVDSLDGSFNHAATLGARETVHGTTTTGNIGFRCAKSPQKRTEYHYVTHDESLHGQLAVEDRFGRRDQIPQRGWEDQFRVLDDDDEDDEEDRPRRKKVVKKRERLSTEL